jgi:hypothetical protein
MIAVPKKLAQLGGSNNLSYTFTKKSIITEMLICSTASGANGLNIIRGTNSLTNQIYKDLPLTSNGGTITISKVGMVMEPGDIISFSAGSVINVFLDGVEFS